MMKKERLRRIQSKVLSTEINLRKTLKKLPSGPEGTVSLLVFKFTLNSFLALAECFESLLEVYEMDADKFSERERKLLSELVEHQIDWAHEVLKDPGYSAASQAKHREYLTDLKALQKKLKRLEAS